jgi:hypothetical protein
MGVFLMEALGITHLFPKMGGLSSKALKRIVIASALFLFFLASVEAALAFMRDIILADKAAATKALITGQSVAEQVRPGGAIGNIPMMGQMVLGFMLPWALAFIAIPFESFMTSLRTVSGVVLVLLVRSIGFLLRISSNIVRNAVHLLVNLYDVAIFIPLVIERLVRKGSGGERRDKDRGGVTSFPKRNSGERTATGEFR